MEMFGITVGAVVIALAAGVVINTLAMWFVAYYLLSIPGIRLKTCFKTVMMLLIVWVVMIPALLLFAMIPFGNIIWWLCLIFALRATIEGTLDVPSGGGTILFLYSIVQLGMIWLINQAMA